ncbi:protein of unknown function [Hyphomicrobium sp. 1Nfss2.1]|uniref:hypothetical protein n=1 Tax=Hyphomicrobium sp. 1Nfss2.1 TaxID=3413936 RepID=UPI003C7AFB87
MLLPDVTPAGQIVFVDYRPSHPSYAMLTLATGGTCLLHVTRAGEKFEATITGLDMAVVDAQLQADLMGARLWLDRQAAAYMREVRRLDIARRLIADAEEGCTLIRADVDRYRLQQLLPAGATPLDLREVL